MLKTLSAVTLVALLALPMFCTSSQSADQQLIPVKPSYSEASYSPQQERQQGSAEVSPMPTPRDQMYVFWLLGKALSYPIDKAEALIMNTLKKRPSDVVPVPAAASSKPSPFASVNWREIPPAPPAKPK